jgi:hypothetical protein
MSRPRRAQVEPQFPHRLRKAHQHGANAMRRRSSPCGVPPASSFAESSFGWIAPGCGKGDSVDAYPRAWTSWERGGSEDGSRMGFVDKRVRWGVGTVGPVAAARRTSAIILTILLCWSLGLASEAGTRRADGRRASPHALFCGLPPATTLPAQPWRSRQQPPIGRHWARRSTASRASTPCSGPSHRSTTTLSLPRDGEVLSVSPRSLDAWIVLTGVSAAIMRNDKKPVLLGKLQLGKPKISVYSTSGGLLQTISVRWTRTQRCYVS